MFPFEPAYAMGGTMRQNIYFRRKLKYMNSEHTLLLFDVAKEENKRRRRSGKKKSESNGCSGGEDQLLPSLSTDPVVQKSVYFFRKHTRAQTRTKRTTPNDN